MDAIGRNWACLITSLRVYHIIRTSVIRTKGANKTCRIDGKQGAPYVHRIDDSNAVGKAKIMLSFS